MQRLQFKGEYYGKHVPFKRYKNNYDIYISEILCKDGIKQTFEYNQMTVYKESWGGYCVFFTFGTLDGRVHISQKKYLLKTELEISPENSMISYIPSSVYLDDDIIPIEGCDNIERINVYFTPSAFVKATYFLN